MAKLRRTGDGAGDEGSSVQILMLKQIGDNKEALVVEDALKPKIGWAIKVGSTNARTYSNQDWWMTTPVTEILEEKEIEKENDIIDYYCKFRTRSHSIYEFWNQWKKSESTQINDTPDQS